LFELGKTNEECIKVELGGFRTRKKISTKFFGMADRHRENRFIVEAMGSSSG
jgi:hypothetical protein